MAARKPLRAVTPEDAAPPAKLTVAAAAATGDHRALLISMRERISVTIDNPNCPPRDLGTLTRRLQDIAKELEQMDLRAMEEGTDDGHTPDESWDSQAI